MCETTTPPDTSAWLLAQVQHQEAARRPARSADLVGVRAWQVCGQDELDGARLADAARRPSRLSPAVVGDLELITDRQRRLYHELSSAEMLVHVEAHAGLLVSLLDSAAPDSLRHTPVAVDGFAPVLTIALW